MSLEILEKYQIRAKKSLGQNFLIDESILNQIVVSTWIQGENIIEIWPGYWALTEKLLQSKPKSLHLVELDEDMLDILKDREYIGDFSKEWIDFQMHHKDVLEYIPSFDEYKVIANIPYYITSPILRHFLYSCENKPSEMLILMQKDVGDKILWKWKNKSSVLSLFIEKKCYVSEKVLVPNECFVPAPKIESSVLLFTAHDLFNEIDDDKFLRLIKTAFSSPRKKLIKNLIQGGYDKDIVLKFYAANNFSENLRWEDLGIWKWCELVERI